MRGFALVSAVLLLASVSSPALAGAETITDGRAGAVMTVPVNKSQVLRLDRAFARAVIGNSEIADVMPLSLSSVYVLGKTVGSTNLALYDRRGGLIAVVDLAVGPDAQALKRQLAELVPGETIGVTATNDTIVLEGHVPSAALAERIAAIAETYAPKKVLNLVSVASPQQVLLEVRFAEMQRATVKQLGINQFSFFNSSADGAIGRTIDETAGPFQGIVNLFGASSGLSIQFDALERQGLIHTLAQPNLVALSGETASFLVGGEFPIPVGSSINGGVTTLAIEFKQFGVGISFTPTVLADGMINLLVAPEVSSIDRETSVRLSGADIPGLKVRRAKTQVELRDGQAFALAGLIQTDFADTVRAIPLLGKIPLFGALFRSSQFNRTETELVIVITPRIVKPVAPSQLALPTDRVTPPSASELFLFGKTERRNSAASLPGVAMPGGIDGNPGHIVR